MEKIRDLSTPSWLAASRKEVHHPYEEPSSVLEEAVRILRRC